MRSSRTVFDTREFKLLQDHWYAKLEEVGFVDAETREGRLKDEGRFVYCGVKHEMLDALSPKYKYVKDNVEDYNRSIQAILNKGKFDEDWHRMVFVFRNEGMTEEEIGNLMNKTHKQINNILHKYIYPDRESVYVKAYLILALKHNLEKNPRERQLISDALAGRSMQRIAKDVGVHIKVAYEMLKSYTNLDTMFHEVPTLKYYQKYFPEGDQIEYVKAFLQAGTKLGAMEIMNVSKPTMLSHLKQAYEVAVQDLKQQIKEV